MGDTSRGCRTRMVFIGRGMDYIQTSSSAMLKPCEITEWCGLFIRSSEFSLQDCKEYKFKM